MIKLKIRVTYAVRSGGFNLFKVLVVKLLHLFYCLDHRVKVANSSIQFNSLLRQVAGEQQRDVIRVELSNSSIILM